MSIRSAQTEPPVTPGVRRLVAVILGAGIVALLAAIPATADAPPQPTFFWPYGKALSGGSNLVPAVQPVIAFVNGIACGSDTTLVATPGEGTPASDVGKTVYAIDVAADGTAVGERAGCGHAGDPVMLYFPQSGMAVQQPSFHQGPQRADLDLVPMGFRLRAPMLASDRSN